MGPFRQKIQQALNNPSLQSALDKNAERRIKVRLAAYESLPGEIQSLRQQARQVRAETINNLEGYLAQFTTRARANGLIVHHAADAVEATGLILQIARQHKARLIAKSKTMISEEIELNHALQSAGLEVVETDLGEYIVQLRGERPAHIITPAVHLKRDDVGRLFEEKLGLPYTEDIPTMTAAARQALRQVFLQADIGVSGVNFGVAESGTLCLVTNEGNGRMVTTLPPVHIALMGVERLVPTLKDLELMLLLLPRSATGQKLTVYTSLIHSPRRPGEHEGPLERHLILLDNGRRQLIGSPFEEALYCIRCGACLNSCPIFREIGGHAYVGLNGETTAYPGPIGSVLSPALFGIPEFGQLARASSLCGACKDACPVDINLPKLLLRVRAADDLNGMGVPIAVGSARQNSSDAKKNQDHPGSRPANPPGSDSLLPVAIKFGLRMYTWAAVSPKRFMLAQRLAGWLIRLISPRSSWMRLPAFSGWGYSRDFPRLAKQTFHQRYAQGQISKPVNGSSPKPALKNIPDSSSVGEITPPDFVEVFREEFTQLGGAFELCSTAELGDKVLALLDHLDADKVQTWEDHLPPGLLKSLKQAGVQIVHDPDPSVKVGITGALAGVADTGSLLLTAYPGRPSTASLLPEIHIAILEARQIYPDLAAIFEDQSPLRQELLEAATAVLISGPSRTADIEMTLTIGVHGPGEVHIFCLI